MCATRQDHGKCSGEAPKAIHDRDWKGEIDGNGAEMVCVTVCPCVSLSTFINCSHYARLKPRSPLPQMTIKEIRSKEKDRHGQTCQELVACRVQ